MNVREDVKQILSKFGKKIKVTECLTVYFYSAGGYLPEIEFSGNVSMTSFNCLQKTQNKH